MCPCCPAVYRAALRWIFSGPEQYNWDFHCPEPTGMPASLKPAGPALQTRKQRKSNMINVFKYCTCEGQIHATTLQTHEYIPNINHTEQT